MAGLLTQRTVKMIGVAGIIVLVIGGGALVVQPAYNQIQNQATEIESVQTSVDSMTASRDKLLLSKENFSKVQEINSSLLKQFPELANVPELLDSITEGAVSVGIEPKNIESITFAAPVIQVPVVPATTDEAAPAEGAEGEAPAAETPAEGETPTVDATVSAGEYAEMEVGLSVTGTESQIEQFLTYLNKMDRVMIISSFSVDVGEQEGGGRTASLALTGKTYIYKAILTPEQILAQQEAGTAEAESEAPTADTGN